MIIPLRLSLSLICLTLPLSTCSSEKDVARNTDIASSEQKGEDKCTKAAESLGLVGSTREEDISLCRTLEEQKAILKKQKAVLDLQNSAHPQKKEMDLSALDAICKAYVRNRFSGTKKDVYGRETRYEVPEDAIMTYGAQKRYSFNNHAFVAFAGFVDRYEDGQIRGREDIPYKYCVFDDESNVIALDSKER